MEKIFRQVQTFLAAPAEHREMFDASDALIWVDWGDEDESVLSYLNDVLPEAAQIDYECTDSETERGFDILLKKDGEAHTIPLRGGCCGQGYDTQDSTGISCAHVRNSLVYGFARR